MKLNKAHLPPHMPQIPKLKRAKLHEVLNGVVPMKQPSTVNVYSFRVFDPLSGDMSVSGFKTTHEIITTQLGGEPIEGTQQEVSVDELDEFGHYRRVATGWGALR